MRIDQKFNPISFELIRMNPNKVLNPDESGSEWFKLNSQSESIQMILILDSLGLND